MKSNIAIYKKLVSNEYDLVGLVAYSLYTNCEIAYIEDYSKNHGKSPQDSDLEAFRSSSLLDAQLELYKGKAEKIMKEIVVNMAQNEVNQIEQQMLKEKDHFIKKIDELKPPKFYIGLIQSIVAAFIVLLFYILAVVHFNLFGLKDGVEKRVVDKTIQEVQKQHPPK